MRFRSEQERGLGANEQCHDATHFAMAPYRTHVCRSVSAEATAQIRVLP